MNPDVFWANVDRSDPTACWLWRGRAGCYGVFFFYENRVGRSVGAHRIAYELANGPIPPGLDIDHLCMVRGCVNPAHLEPVTRSENVRRAHAFRSGNKRLKYNWIVGHLRAQSDGDWLLDRLHHLESLHADLGAA